VLLVMASIGGLGFSAPTIYSTGLDLDAAAGPRLTRAAATWIMGAATIVLVLVGSLVWDASESLTAASLILLALTAPWAAIVGIGHIRCRGRYHDDDLQVFNRRERGVGIYWFTGGWNWRAVLAWAAGAAFGVATVTAPPLYTGPFANVAKGIDVSFFGAFLIAGISYIVLEAVADLRRSTGARPAPIQEPKA
jgi:purine-cytosine permease-like protein